MNPQIPQFLSMPEELSRALPPPPRPVSGSQHSLNSNFLQIYSTQESDQPSACLNPSMTSQSPLSQAQGCCPNIQSASHFSLTGNGAGARSNQPGSQGLHLCQGWTLTRHIQATATSAEVLQFLQEFPQLPHAALGHSRKDTLLQPLLLLPLFFLGQVCTETRRH